jgi:hypothetical protein
MPKPKKRRSQGTRRNPRQRTQSTYGPVGGNPELKTPAGSERALTPEEQPSHNDESVTDPAVERYRRKQTRRRILHDFEQLCDSAQTLVPHKIVGFVASCLSDLELAREALQPFKNSSDVWASEVWRLLALPDSDLRSEIAFSEEERGFAIASAKMLIRHKLPDPVVFRIPTTVHGPAYESVGPEQIHAAICAQLDPDPVSFEVQGEFPFSKLGIHSVALCFEAGTPMPINVELALELDEIPEDVQRAWEATSASSHEAYQEVPAALRTQLARHPQESEETQREIARLLQTAHGLGFWKTADAQQLLRRWRAGNKAIKARAEMPVRVDEPELPAFSHSRELQESELEKLRILDLPPLVSFDLVNATVDLNMLQRLFGMAEFAHFRGRRLEELSEEDIRSLSPSTGWSIRDFRARRAGGGRRIDSRGLAKILLSVARLQFEMLETGTCEADIRFCLSNYSTRMGEYLVQQHGRYDLARDYYLAAISLNLESAKTDVARFPTNLLFRSFPSDSSVPPIHDTSRRQKSPGEFLHLLDQPIWQTQEVFQTASRSFLELGSRHFPWASRWFEELLPQTRHRLLSHARSQLGLGDLTDFSDCIDAYSQEIGHFRTLLREMRSCSSLHGLVQTRNRFREQLSNLGFLLSPTNREIAGLLAQGADAVEQFLASERYEQQRSHADTAMNLLDRVLDYGSDNYTAVWAEHFGAIAHNWRKLVSDAISTIARDIAPVLQVSLAEEHLTLIDSSNERETARLIFRIENTGSGDAARVNILFGDADGSRFDPKKRDQYLRSGEVVEDFISLHRGTSEQPLEISYTLSYYDPDQQKRTTQGTLTARPLADSRALVALANSNPFSTDHEVDDERMFVGRDHLLDEVGAYAIDQPRGSLLMLYGQRRVGKSSVLLFLEKQADSVGRDKQALGVRVTWLNYTTHTAADLLYEIAMEIGTKHQQMYQQGVSLPSLHEFRSGYSLAFNMVLRELQTHGVRRLVLMWDEFDGLVNHLDNPAMGFDRVFFEYLRGLSKRRDVALVLTGGELMPMLFERWGEVFNHDRTWRIAYLSPTDGSVERLVRNEYVKGILEFSDDALRMIKEYSACNPFFVQMICRELVSMAKSQKSSTVCMLDVEETIGWLVRKGLDARHVRHLYCPRLEPDPLDMAIIGIATDEEKSRGRGHHVPVQAMLEGIVGRPEDETLNRVGELVRREILQRNSKNPSEVRMRLPLFRDWFYDNHPEYQLWAPLLRR